MVNEKDLQEINKKLIDGYDIHIHKTAFGVKIVAEKTKAIVLKNSNEAAN